MFNIRQLFNNRNEMNKNGVKIIYEDGNVKNKVLSWCKYFKIDDLGELLIKLGFKETDVIYLYENYGNLSEVIYSVNKERIDNTNTIEFNYKNKEITVSDKDVGKCYSINQINSKNDYELELIYCKKKISDNMYCFHKYGKTSSLFIIDNGDYELTLEMDLNLGTGGYYLNEVVDEDDLEDYLINLEFPIVIDNVYKEIGEILKLDESVYEMFNLVVTKNVCKKKVDIVTDEILIQKGELWRITKTSDGRRVTLDKDGNWSYDKLDNDMVFTVRYSEDNGPKYRYRFKDGSKEENGYFSEDSFVDLKKDAKKEVEEVKKLVKTIF